jgi:hypothetical protein
MTRYQIPALTAALLAVAVALAADARARWQKPGALRSGGYTCECQLVRQLVATPEGGRFFVVRDTPNSVFIADHGAVSGSAQRRWLKGR